MRPHTATSMHTTAGTRPKTSKSKTGSKPVMKGKSFRSSKGVARLGRTQNPNLQVRFNTTLPLFGAADFFASMFPHARPLPCQKLMTSPGYRESYCQRVCHHLSDCEGGEPQGGE